MKPGEFAPVPNRRDFPIREHQDRPTNPYTISPILLILLISPLPFPALTLSQFVRTKKGPEIQSTTVFFKFLFCPFFLSNSSHFQTFALATA
jgi:hypothetical protein